MIVANSFHPTKIQIRRTFALSCPKSEFTMKFLTINQVVSHPQICMLPTTGDGAVSINAELAVTKSRNNVEQPVMVETLIEIVGVMNSTVREDYLHASRITHCTAKKERRIIPMMPIRAHKFYTLSGIL